MFESHARAQVLTEEQLDLIHDRAMTILEEIGTEVRHDGALELLAAAGQNVDGTRVRWDREFVMEMLAKAPETFTVRGRNPERAVTLGGGSFVLTPVGGSPFCSDLERGRREGSMRDYLELVKMAQAADLLTCQQSGVVEASDLDDQTRHMDMDYAVIRWSDKPYVCYGTSGPKARDAVNLAAIACGGREEIEKTPGMLGVVNPNSPLVWDWLMADALIEWATANQPVVVTPFLLAGATAPVSIAGGLAQQVAEALSGVALAQTVRPGAPCVFGSFFSAVDMRTGGPSFGTPESVLGCIAGGQLARRYKIPFRGGGGLCSGNALDAQAASESLNMLWATFMAGSDLVMHAAGWLEGGLTASYEKLALDLEVLRMFVVMREGIGIERGGVRDRRDPRGGARRHVPRLDAHARALPRLGVHEPAVQVAGLRHLGEAGRAHRRPVRPPREWKRLLESYEDPGIDPRDRRGAAGVHHAPPLGDRGRERRMSRLERHDILFEPVKIGPKTLRNRFYQVPHCTGFGVEKPWTQAAFRGMKAEGGWAAVCTEYCSISPESDETPYVSARLWDDEDMRALQLMTAKAHEHGSLAGVELWHGGVYAEAPRVAAGPARPLADRQRPRQRGRAQGDDPRRHPARAGASGWRRPSGRAPPGSTSSTCTARTPTCRRSFCRRSTTTAPTSTAARSRTARGSGCEAIELVKAAVGDDVAIAVRIAADTLELSGVPIDEGLEFIRMADPMVDLWDVVIGSMWGTGRLDSGPSRFFEQGYQMEWSGRAREATAEADRGGGPVHRSRPHGRARARRHGRPDRRRPPVDLRSVPAARRSRRAATTRSASASAVTPATRARSGAATSAVPRTRPPARSIAAAGTPRSSRAPRTPTAPRSWSAPGRPGMECAIVLGKRGMELVHMVDSGDDIGGSMRWVTRLPGLGGWGHVIDYRRVQLDRLENVSVGLGDARSPPQDMLEYGAQIVIVATGSHWAGDGLSGVTRKPIPGADANLPHVLTPEQMMVEGKRPPGIAGRGGRLRGLLRRRDDRREASKRRLRGRLRHQPRRGRAVLRPDARGPARAAAAAQARACAPTARAWCSGSPPRASSSRESSMPGSELAVDGVVLVTQRVSDDALYHELMASPDALAEAGVEARLPDR